MADKTEKKTGLCSQNEGLWRKHRQVLPRHEERTEEGRVAV